MAILARQRLIGFAAACAGVFLVTVLYRKGITDVNATTVALSFLLVVLMCSSAYGLTSGIVASVAGMLCFNFYFLPPVGTFTIQDPQNWVALFAFLVTAVIASQLSAAAQSRASDAERRREEVWRLYELSRAIMATPDSETAASSIARQVVDVFKFEYCGVFAPDATARWTRLAAAGDLAASAQFTPDQGDIGRAYITGETQPAEYKDGVAIYQPLKVGLKPIGVMVLRAPAVGRPAVEAIAGLVALALERARFLTEVSHTEALRQSDEFKSALLASVSHDLRTPLTAIRAAIDNLLKEEIAWEPAALREFHLIISEEVRRLTRLVQNLLEMARIDAGELNIAKEWASLAELFGHVLDRCTDAVRGHRVTVKIGEDTPLVKIDSRLVAEAVTNLVENAAKYSPPGTEISLEGFLSADDEDDLVIRVADQGPGISADDIGYIFDKFYRGRSARTRQVAGTGMGLAIARGVIAAHGGRIGVESPPGGGAIFTLTIPVEWRPAAEAAAVQEHY